MQIRADAEALLPAEQRGVRPHPRPENVVVYHHIAEAAAPVLVHREDHRRVGHADVDLVQVEVQVQEPSPASQGHGRRREEEEEEGKEGRI